ncbi:MAG: hypothetical protein ACMUEM_06875 [Flavobacteriales bacterium AspAUS03]
MTENKALYQDFFYPNNTENHFKKGLDAYLKKIRRAFTYGSDLKIKNVSDWINCSIEVHTPSYKQRYNEIHSMAKS